MKRSEWALPLKVVILQCHAAGETHRNVRRGSEVAGQLDRDPPPPDTLVVQPVRTGHRAALARAARLPTGVRLPGIKEQAISRCLPRFRRLGIDTETERADDYLGIRQRLPGTGVTRVRVPGGAGTHRTTGQ